MILHVKTDRESKKIYLFFFYWSFQLLIRRITSVISFALGFHDYVEIFNAILWVTVSLLCLDVIITSLKLRDIVFIMFVLMISLLGSIIWPDNDLIEKNRVTYFTSVFSFYFIGRTFYIKKENLKKLAVLTHFIILLNLIIYLFYYLRGFGEASDMDHNMGFAYVLLPYTLFCIYYSGMSRNLKDVVVSVIATVLMLIQGTRGPILCLGVFIIWDMLRFNSRAKKVFFALTGLLFFYFMTTWNGIVFFSQTFINLGERIGFSIRIFEKMTSLKALIDANGRDTIRHMIQNSLQSRPYTGLGPYGDMLVTMKRSGFTNGTYAHNIIIEFICDYGYIIGIFLLIVLFINILRAYCCIKEDYYKAIYMIYVMQILKMMFSDSYLISKEFYIMLGMTMSLSEGRLLSSISVPLKEKYYPYIMKKEEPTRH